MAQHVVARSAQQAIDHLSAFRVLFLEEVVSANIEEVINGIRKRSEPVVNFCRCSKL